MSYDFSWHLDHGRKTSRSATVALSILREIVPFNSVLDIGCGDGRWLKAAQELGATEIQGVDGPWTDRDRLLIDRERVLIRDLEEDFGFDRKFDLAMSLEVAEHVSENSARSFVRKLTGSADLVLFGAAIPNQGGYRHINEQWQSYWNSMFADEGFVCFDVLRSRLWDRDDCHFWYAQNALTYVRSENTALVEKFSEFIETGGSAALPVDIVHPALFESIANYRQIAFKPLMKRLPRATLRKANDVLRRRI